MKTHSRQHLAIVQQQVKRVDGVEAIQCDELVALRIENESASAVIFLQGAQIASYQPRGQQAVLWLSDSCEYKRGKPLRGGIPVCWPWFGDLSRNPQAIIDQVEKADKAPAHGFVRDQEWQLDQAVRKDTDTTMINLSLDIDNDNAQGWQFPCRLTLEVHVGKVLDIAFRVDNTGLSDFFASSALHSYFSVSDIANVSVEGLSGVEYVDSLQGWQRYSQKGQLQINQEVDRIYQSVPDMVAINDAGLLRKIRLRQASAPSLVVWNPWIEKARRLSCFGNDDYLGMVCLETAQVLEHAQTIRAGSSGRIGLTIESD
ncbi:MAG: D-hexose-6-phosphate mutarotase [Pseudomonadales bacterium]